jgi:hypothetical protein
MMAVCSENSREGDSDYATGVSLGVRREETRRPSPSVQT